jgi:hypothetical protein
MNDALDILRVDAGLLIYEITDPHVSQRRAFDDLDSKFNGFLVFT